MIIFNPFRKASRSIIPFFFSLVLAVSASAQVKITQQSWSLPTYMVMPGEKAPMFYSGGNFQGARRVIYPYALNDVISHERIEHEWKALILENEYIQLCVTPEIGGKLYYATDKTNDYNFVYKNNEVKPSNIGMTGAWVSGGIEWCVLHHHRASTMLPMDYSTVEHADGSKTIYIGETEPRHRMRWNVGVTVRPGRSYFEAELTIYNPTPHTHTFLYWANVAAHTNNDFQTIFPPSVQVATFHSKNQFTNWPYSTEVFRTQDFTAGVDVSYWKNVRKNASFFAWDLQEDFMGGYDHGKQAGTVHIGDHNIVKGAKLWEWGSGPRGQATEGKLTETSGPYVEIMVGAFSDNQPDYTWIRPYETKRWKQYWYPVKDIGGFKNANLDAAVNLEQRDGNKVFLGYYSTQLLSKAKVILKHGDKELINKEIVISPEKTFTKEIDLPSGSSLTDLYTELVNVETGEVIISYQQVERARPEQLPEIVKPPAKPEDIETIEELYVTGSRMEQFYKSSTPYYEEALKRDPGDIRTNTAIGNQLLKNGDFENARKYFSRAIKRLTTDYTRPSTTEPLYLQGLTLKALGLNEAARDTLYRATWDYAWHSAAYFELAQISCIEGDFKRALKEINESISTNTRNHRAVSLKASILRHLGENDEALEVISPIVQDDPLNFRAINEQYMVAQALNSNDAEELKEELLVKMRSFAENYLEVAVGYINDGMNDEAIDLLARYEGDPHPIILYYQGYLASHKGQEESAKEYISKAQDLSEERVFPFRLETIDVLNSALKLNPEDKKAHYYLGNILYDKQPTVAMQHWEKAVQNDPTLAMAYRNLGWGSYRQDKDVAKAISYYEKAIELDDTDAIFYEELDRLYELNNSQITTRMKIFEGKNKVVRRRDGAFIRQITVLTLAGHADKSVEYLEDKVFSYREGTSRVRETIIDAHLSLGIKYFENKEYEKALEQFMLARVPEEEAGSARYGNRDIQVHYFIARAYEALNQKDKAKEYDKMAATASAHGKPGIMNFYQGLSMLELKEKSDAKEVFEQLVAVGDEQIKKQPEETGEFFAIFGERDAESTRRSLAYTLRGLGYKGLSDDKKAAEDLKKAIEYSESNLWARTELER